MESVGQSVMVTNFPTNCNTHKTYKHHFRKTRGEEEKKNESECQTNRKTREYENIPVLPSQGNLKLLDIT